MEVADRVVVMSNGAIEQVGTPSEVWHQPVNGFVYDFLGNYNEFEGWRDADGTVHLTEYDFVDNRQQPAATVKPAVRPDMRRFPRAFRFLQRIAPGLVSPPRPLPAQRTASPPRPRSLWGTPVKLYARPHELYIVREPNGHNEYISARILHINPAGPLAKLELERRNGNLLQAEVPAAVIESQGLVRGLDVLVRPTSTRIFE